MSDTFYNCSINGKRCCNGIREDFTGAHPVTGEKIKCNEWINVIGVNPQTGEKINNWMCGRVALPLLLVENSNQQRQTAASVDKVANQIQRSRAEFLGALPPEAQKRLVESDVRMLEEKANGATQ